jgi:hypothetical protein
MHTHILVRAALHTPLLRTQAAISKMTTYSAARQAYDAEYNLNKTVQVAQLADDLPLLLATSTETYALALANYAASVRNLTDALVSCVSPRNQVSAHSCW